MMRGILAGLIQAPKAQKTVARCEREALSAWLLKSKDGRAPEAREEINRSDSVVFRPYRAPMSLLGYHQERRDCVALPLATLCRAVGAQ